MTKVTERALLSDLLAGRLDALPEVESWSHEHLARVAAELDLRLDPSAVAGVIDGYQEGRYPMTSVQRWASLMRHGYCADASGDPIEPIFIEYDERHESAIVEALSRLTELGDVIDGELRPGESAELVSALRG
ncbi:MAG TPA: hypothetical protein VFL65_08695 [Jatrophihabitans sp.]|nr:hypothetical protein [Jatrophihabitans sp.]